MEAIMSRTEMLQNDPSRRAAELVDDTITSFRNRGVTRQTALGLAAKALGVSLRRARSLAFGEPVAVKDAELKRIQTAFISHLDEEIAHLSARQEAIKARRNAMVG